MGYGDVGGEAGKSGVTKLTIRKKKFFQVQEVMW